MITEVQEKQSLTTNITKKKTYHIDTSFCLKTLSE